MYIVFYHINDSTFILIIKAIRAKLFPNHCKISKMYNVNIQVFTSAGTPGVQPVDFFKYTYFVDRLRKMWDDALKSYINEEQNLRSTLEKNAADEETNAFDLENQKITSEWENILFGPKIIPNETYWGLTCAEKDLGTFIAIRKSWDTFLVPNEFNNGSRIPIGWILPDSNNPGSWSQFLRKD